LRIFLTGATGYIGKALCLRLRAAGHELRALARPASRTELLESIGVGVFRGDLAERSSMREGMSGADWVIHAAAELDLEAAADRMESANVAGSENVASLAYKLGVPRFLSVSSIARWGGSPDDGTPASEETPPRWPLPTRYCRTKAAGEEAIQTWAKRGLKVNTVYPSLVYGPPGKKSGSNALLRQLDRGRFPAMIGGDRKSSWIFLDDLVEGRRPGARSRSPSRGGRCASPVPSTGCAGGARPSRSSSSPRSSATGPSTTPAPAPSSTGARARSPQGCR